MNKIHRLIWNEITRTWVPAAENSRARGKRSAARLLVAAALLPLAAWAQVAPNALPTGGQVVAGQVAIQQNGSTLTVQQGSTRGAIDWQQFNVGRDAQVQFQQPSAQSVTLNRVQGPDASQIFGRITANGQVFLSNPHGVYFAPGASVDVGGLVATTHRISLDDFMAGRTRFERQGATGSVVNEGELRAALGGYVALLAPEVRNQGVIVANLGTVALAAGEAFELQFDANQTLAGLRVEASTLRTLVDNRHLVLAPGGLVILSAQALDRVQGGVVRNAGRIEATGLAQRGGRIVLEASGQVVNSGRIDASASADGPAGSVRLQAPEVVNSGSITAAGSAAHPQGGQVEVVAGSFTQTDAGRIDASAPAQGGRVQLRASGPVALAGQVSVAATPLAPAPAAAPAASPAPAAHAPAEAPAPAQGGEINIQAAQIRLPAAALDASGGQGGRIVLDASAPASGAPAAPAPLPAPERGQVVLQGTAQLSTRGRRGQGGLITLLGDDLRLHDQTLLDASGATGGGSVRVGGGWQGGEGLYAAGTVAMDGGARIDASATTQGDGGSVVLWSDVTRDGGLTTAQGQLLARGAGAGGHGGRVETSGHQVDTQGLRVDAGAPQGSGGLWLIDPYNYTIGSAQASTIAGSLNTGTSVTINTSANNTSQGSSGNSSDVGRISVNSSISKTSGGDATLTLQAHNDIVFTGAGVTSSSGKLNLVLVADWDSANGGAIWLNGSGTPITVTTNGGHLWMGGNGYFTAFGTATWSGLSVGTGLANSSSFTSVYEGVNINRASITTGGGNLFIAGRNARYNNGENRFGVLIQNSSSLSTGAGTVEVRGSLQALAGTLSTYPNLFGVDINGSSIATTNGTITITGGEAATDVSNNASGLGVRLYNASVTATTGTIAITGTTGTDNGAGGSRDGLQLFAEGSNARTTVSTTNGTITLTGTSNVSNQANSGGIVLKTANSANADSANPAVKVVSTTGNITLNGNSPNNANADADTGSGGIRIDGSGYGLVYIGQDQTGTYSGILTLSASSVMHVNLATGYLRLRGSGPLTIQPLGTSFFRGTDTQALIDFNDRWSFGSSHAAITLGKVGNASDITVSSDLTVAGPIRLYGANLTANANLTSTVAGAEILLKGSGNVVVGDTRNLQTDGGNITLWADTDANGGYIWLTNNNVIDSRSAADRAAGNTTTASGGGQITLGGGNGASAADGAAWSANVADRGGVNFGSQTVAGHANYTRLYSGGGNVVVRGQATDTDTSNMQGINWVDGGEIDAGRTGTVSLVGDSSSTASGGSTSHGIEFGSWGAGSIAVLINAGGGDALTPAIEVQGTTNGSGNGIQGGTQMQAARSGGSTAGGILVTGRSDSGWGIVGTRDSQAQSGSIVIDGGTGGYSLDGSLGARSGSLVTSSSSNVTLIGDRVQFQGPTTVDTSGTLAVQSFGNSFSSTLDWPISGLTLSSSVSGLTLGKDVPGVAKTDVINLNFAQTIAGPVAVYGGGVNVNAALTAAGHITLVSSDPLADLLVNAPITSTASGTSNLLLKAVRNVSVAAGADITGAGGPMNTQLWADADRDGDGINRLLSSIDTRGGWLKFGNDETATLNGVSTRVGGDVFFNGSSAQTIATGGGRFDLFGEAILANTAGLTINTAGGNVNFYGVLNSGNTYTFVDKSGSGGGSWTQARTEAINFTGGRAAVGDSYLVTITSRLENSLASLAANYKGAWMGAWRANPTSSWAWTWADGPEAGQNFFNQTSGGVGGSAVAGRFNNFSPNEPNGTLSANESVGQFYGNSGRWNDLPPTDTYSSAQSGIYSVLGFVRETNLANSPLTINAGSGLVNIQGAVGGSKPLASLNVQAAATTVNGSALITSGAQTYNNALSVTSSGDLTVGATTLSVTNAQQAALFKAAGNVALASGLAITTRNGDLTVWSNSSNAGTAGAISLGNSVTLNTANGATNQATGGGRIVLAGGLDDGSNGGTAGDGLPDGYAASATASGITLGTAGVAGNTRLYSGGGDIVLRGSASGSGNAGILWNKTGTVVAGNGTVSLTGSASQGHGLELGAASGSAAITAGGGDASHPAIVLQGSSSSTGHTGIQTSGGSLQSTGAGGITVSGATAAASTAQATNLGLDVLAASGPIDISAGGGTGLRYGGTLGKKAATSVTASSSNVTLTADALTVNGSVAVDATGTLTVQPFNTSFSSALSWPIANFSVAGITGLTLGKAGNTADISVNAAQTIAGPIRLHGGNLTLAAGLTATGSTVTLQASGTVADTGSGFVSANGLLLLGGNVLLDGAGTSIGTLAASGVASLDVRNSSALTIGSVLGTSGIGGTGPVAVSTQSGDLTLAASVATTHTGTGAIVLNAGRAAAAGTAAGGNLIVSGSPSLSTGAGGRATLYSGAVAGSTGLTALVGSGSGRFRYNSDESSTNFSTALGSGVYAIYRERPVVSLGWNNQSMVYGAAQPSNAYTVNSGSLVNGDVPTASLGGSVLSGAGQLAVSGSPYTVTDGGALNALGYDATVTNGSLTVTPRSLVASFTGVDKVYDGGTAATVSLADDRLAGDALSLAYGSASFLDKQVGSGKTVNVGGVTLSGADAGNYALASSSGSTTAAITPRTLTVTWSGVDKVYDGSTTASVGSSDDRVSGDLLTVAASAAFADAHAGTGKTVNVTGVSLSGADALNYSVAGTSSATAAITPKTLTLSATKVYDGSTTLGAGSISLGGLVGSETLAYSGGSASNAHVAPAGKFVSSLTLLDGSNGGRAANYALPTLDAANAPVTITPKALTATAGIGGTTSKVYDGSAAAGAAQVTGTVSGAVAGDTLALDVSGLSLAYDSAHVASATQIAASGSAGFWISSTSNGSQASDYSFTAPTIAAVAGSITPKALTAVATIGGASSKVYDGSAAAPGATLTGTVSGAIAGDTLSLDTSGLTLGYDSAHVASATQIAASGSAGFGIGSSASGSQATDYSFTAPTIAPVAGSITPKALTATAAIGGATSKVYDGSAAASGANVTGTVSGAIAGDTLSLDTSGLTLGYNSAHVASATQIAASGSAGFGIGSSASGSQASDYSFTAPTIAAVAGSITPRALTAVASIGGTLTKVYDGSAAATGASVSGTVSGAIAGDTLSLETSGLTLGYNSAHVASATQIAASGSTGLLIGSSASGSQASDYSFTAPTITAVAGSITPKALTATAAIGGATSKVYDGSAAASAANVTGTVAGAIAGDTLGLDTSGLTLAYDSAHVASATQIAASGSAGLLIGSSASGSQASDYSFTAPTIAPVAGSITPKALTAAAAIGGTLTKVYDGTAAAPGASVSGSVSGAIAGDALALDTSGLTLAYDSAHVASATQVAASGSVGLLIGSSAAGSQFSDYQLSPPTIAPVAARITPAALTATLTHSGVSKVYDGSTDAPSGFVPAWHVVGLVAGDTGASVSHTGAAYDSKDVTQASRLTVSGMAVAAIAGDNGSLASDYQLTATQQDVAASITPRTVTVTGLAAASKVYDGTDAVALTQIGELSGLVGAENLGLSLSQARFDNANAGTGKTVTATGYLLANGSGASAGLAANYQLASTSATTTADIGKATLTVIANNDARFVTQPDAPGYAGVSYSGFVRGETAGVLGGAASVTRSNPGDTLVGSYAGVLVPDVSGLSSGNYSFQLRSGDFTIVPAGQLLVRVAPTRTAYGTAASYTLASAQYLDNGNLIRDVAVTPEGGGRFTLADGAGGTATLTLVPAQAGSSSAGWTTVGTWQLAATDVSTQNAANFNNTLTVVGSETVVPRALDIRATGGISKVYDGTVGMPGLRVQLVGAEAADQLSVSASGRFASKNAGSGLAYTITGVALAGADAGNYYLSNAGTFSGTDGSITPRPLNTAYTGVNKVYDGHTVANVTVSDDRIAGDLLTVQAAAQFADKNVGTGKAVTITGAQLTGPDAGNYMLTSTSGSTTADITRLGSVTWTGGATGNWFDPANWAGGAVPDLANVANVVIPAGVVVRFDTAGAVAPAQTGPVLIDSLGGSGGGLVQANGALDVGSGGVTLASLAQSGGTLGIAGDVVLGNFSQTGGTVATQGNLAVNGQFSQGSSGSVTVAGNTTITDTAGGATLGNLQTGGELAVTSTGGDVTQQAGSVITVGGATTVSAAGGNVVLDGANNDFQGAFNASGHNITVVDGIGGLVIGDITAAGGFNATSTGGDVTQQAGSVITVGGATTVAAPGSNITLDGANNDFQGAFNANGNSITVVDGTGGLVLGDIAAAGGFNATSTGGDVTQQAGSVITVGGATTIAAPGSNITLDGANNDFQGAFNASGNNITVVDGHGGLVLGDITAAGGFDATSTGGDITQQAGSVITVGGDTTIAAPGSNITLDGANNDFQGPFNASGVNITVVDGIGGLVIGNIAAAGGFNATSAGGDVTQQAGSVITVGGQTTVAAPGSNITLDGANNDFQGAFNASGANITVVDGIGGLVIGDITAAGGFNATSIGGAITQRPGSSVVVAGVAQLSAPGSGITLSAIGNRFGTAPVLNGVKSGTEAPPIAPSVTPPTVPPLVPPVVPPVAPAVAPPPSPPAVPPRVRLAAPTVLPPLMPPAVLPVPEAAPLAIDASVLLAGSAPGAQSPTMFEGVSVQLSPAPTPAGEALMTVRVPQPLMATGFSFGLPEALTADLAGDAPVAATLEDGEPLPTWLHFDARRRQFSATAVPPQGLPLRVRLRLGDRSAVVVLTAA